MKTVLLFLLVLIISSCKESEQDRITRLVSEWEGRIIRYPSNAELVSIGKDSIPMSNLRNTDYTIVSYIDSIGCMSCKLQLPEWELFIKSLKTSSENQMSCLFFFHPNDENSLIRLLHRTRFSYPIYIDRNDVFNKLNNFPPDIMFQTFLVDKNNKVVAIGNPIHNPKVKELYLNIISGKKDLRKTNTSQTTASLSEVDIDMGEFDWNKKQEREITISNTGNGPLAISDVTTSCGCTTVEYTKEPIMPKKSGILKITYQAEHPEHFNKTVSIHCNTPTSPMQIKVTGNAK